MLNRLLLLALLLLGAATPAEARRVALIVAQNAYPGGGAATVGLAPLHNPAADARLVSALLARHGFELIACEGRSRGCDDLDKAALLAALAAFEQRADGADTALVYFAGHGMATPQGNMLAPLDARFDCATGEVAQGVPVETLMAATRRARNKIVIIDACRDNPLGKICPGLKGRVLAFTEIRAPALSGFLLVTSTQFGQQALDGRKGATSPFAAALAQSLELNPHVYFEQVMNAVAHDTRAAVDRKSVG